MSAFAVVNPRSASGRTRIEWPAVERSLREIYPGLSVSMTQARGQATGFVRNALQEGHTEIIAVGGDGTINEAINGFFDEEGSIAPDALFAFVTSGTGGDFRKSFDVAEGPTAGIARLKIAKPRPIDVGRVSCLTAAGAPTYRYFVNIASFGLSGQVVDSVNRARIAKLFGGPFAFAFHSALDMLTYGDRVLRLRVDDGFDEEVSISTAAVANGQYFGGGMRVAPQAIPDDGLFDVIVMGSATRAEAIADMRLLYAGEHVNLPHVRSIRGRKVMAVPVAETKGRPVLIELDGESAGRLPATFEILPRALILRC
jgi:YegS/Rv2252/BmrU family lipid kinase